MAESRSKPAMVVVRSPGDIPKFLSEADETQFWATHELADELWETAEGLPDDVLPPPRPRTRSIAVRIDDSILLRMKALASRRHKGYQTLLKEFLVERLYEEEKRDGIVG